MSLHQRKREIKVSTDRENVHLRTKTMLQVPKTNATLLTKRPALGELGNKLHCQQNQSIALKKLVPSKSIPAPSKPAPVPIKKSAAVTEKDSSAVIKKEPVVRNVVKTDKAPNNLKRQESNLFKVKLKNYVEKEISGEQIAYSSKPLIGIIDVDIADKDDPILVSEYIQDIFSYLLTLEAKYPIRRHFLDSHRATSRMRSVLINWMVEVHLSFKFLLETFHLSVAIVDRYLQVCTSIGRETLQLVGTSAMLVASKYEEMYIPDISDFVYICDDTFSSRQILVMEKDILKKLKFEIGRPLSVHFLRRYNKVAQVQPEHHTLGKYLLELALIEYDLCHFSPSIQAAAACCLAISVLNNVLDPAVIWTKTLVHYSTYKYSDIKVIVANLACAVSKAETSKYQAIRQKYAASSFGKISMNPKLKGPLIRKLISEASTFKLV